MYYKKRIFFVILSILLLTACTHHNVKVEPIKSEHIVEVKPMEMTITVNVNVRVDRALEDFFGDLDAAQVESIDAEQEKKTGDADSGS